MDSKRYVIEKRHANGSLCFAGPQPEDFFGERAITGITLDQIAREVFRRHPEAVLTGENIPDWARSIDARFAVREKTW